MDSFYAQFINSGECFVVDGDVYNYANVLNVDCKMDKNGNPVYDLEMVNDKTEKKYHLTIKGTDAYAFDRLRVREKSLRQWREEKEVEA